MFKKLFKSWRQRFLSWKSDETVIARYVESGNVFGEVVSYLYMGECDQFEDYLNEWLFWEKEYARRGYKPISLDLFIKSGGYGVNLSAELKQRQEGQPVFHAELYRQHYLGKIQPVIDPFKNEVQIAQFLVPSTEIFTKTQDDQ